MHVAWRAPEQACPRQGLAQGATRATRSSCRCWTVRRCDHMHICECESTLVVHRPLSHVAYPTSHAYLSHVAYPTSHACILLIVLSPPRHAFSGPGQAILTSARTSYLLTPHGGGDLVGVLGGSLTLATTSGQQPRTPKEEDCIMKAPPPRAIWGQVKACFREESPCLGPCATLPGEPHAQPWLGSRGWLGHL